jgi:hypothetical protein
LFGKKRQKCKNLKTDKQQKDSTVHEASFEKLFDYFRYAVVLFSFSCYTKKRIIDKNQKKMNFLIIVADNMMLIEVLSFL